MTVKELKESLGGFADELQVIIAYDGGYAWRGVGRIFVSSERLPDSPNCPVIVLETDG